MSVAIGRMYVESPAFTALPYGLLTSLGQVFRTPSDPHWQNGVNYEPLCGSGSTTYDVCLAVSGTGDAPVAVPPIKAATAALDKRGATSFTVFTQVDCSAPGFWDRAEEIVETQLTRNEQWQVERAFWTGQAAGSPVVYPHLAADTPLVDPLGITLQTAAVATVTGAVDVVEGVGVLEGMIANCYDGVPVIHVPRALASTFARFAVIVRDGPRYRTHSGSIVIFGSGYPGTAPDGTTTPADALWIYATGAPFIYRSRPTVMQARDSINRADNTVHAIAERTYVLGWDCCHYGIPITTGGVVAGAAGSSS